MTLVEFLLARITDDEERVSAGAPGIATSYEGWHTVECGVDLGYWATNHCTCRYVDRVLAECASKRRIIAAHQKQVEDDDPMSWIVASEELLEALALPYADHRDYDPSWRP